MRALIVGLGSIGTRHLNNLYDLGVEELSVFRSRNLPPPAEIKPADYTVYYDYDEALASGPDIVVIANPTALHVPFTARAIDRGCHVYMEKPVSHEMSGVEEMAAAAGARGLTVAMGCQIRFHPNMEDIKSWVAKGLTGRITSAKVVSGEYLPHWHPWEDYRQSYAARSDLGGGVVLTQIHELDYLYWLLGPVDSVKAEGGHRSSLEIDVEDTAVMSMRTRGGASVDVSLDYVADPPVRKMEISGTGGEITWDYYAGIATLMRDDTVVEESGIPEGWERNDLFLALMKDFLQAVREGTPPRIPLTEGIEVLKIALAVKESMVSGKAVHL